MVVVDAFIDILIRVTTQALYIGRCSEAPRPQRTRMGHRLYLGSEPSVVALGVYSSPMEPFRSVEYFRGLVRGFLEYEIKTA